ncbi:MAG: response regulator [Bryobacteraceae bacterium]|nr:response regulator [Bryobacteraceae bacterium]
MILAVMDDLIFGVKLREAARRAGQMIDFAARPEAVLAKAAMAGTRVILDLNLRQVDTVDLVRRLKAAGVPVIAYVAHVQVDLRRAAEEAGADQVLARSSFVTKIDQLVQPN